MIDNNNNDNHDRLCYLINGMPYLCMYFVLTTYIITDLFYTYVDMIPKQEFLYTFALYRYTIKKNISVSKLIIMTEI